MGMNEVKFYYWMVRFIPEKVKYFCFMHIMSHATTGKYSNTVVPDLSGMDAIKRYSDDFNV